CQRAEREFVGTPCGLMDMLAIAAGRAERALLIDCRSDEITPIPLPPRDRATLLVADTGAKHELAGGEYAQRPRDCEEAARRLGVKSLREATLKEIATSSLSEALRRRAEHVVAENERTLAAATAIQEGNLAKLGELMFQSHESLRDLFDVSCVELDCL